MNKHTIYGLPLNPMPLLDKLEGASFCVSFGTREKLGKQLDQAIQLVGQDGILLVDNGAFSIWQAAKKRGQDPVEAGLFTMTETYLDKFEAWALDILSRCPQAIAVIPDVICGTQEQNDELIRISQLPFERSMPVWHLDESIDRLLGMVMDGWDYVAFGSTVMHEPGSPEWHDRIREAFDAIDTFCAESDGAYIRPRIHMMRAQSHAHKFGFDSSDSTNVAVNHNRQRKISGEDIVQFAARVDGKIQASAGPAAEHQIKRPLLGHLDYAEWRAAFWLETLKDSIIYRNEEEPMIEVGTRVKVVQPIDNYPDCYIKPGETGTITEINDDAIWVKLDAPHPELKEWDNAVEIWDWSDAEHPEWHPSRSLEAL